MAMKQRADITEKPRNINELFSMTQDACEEDDEVCGQVAVEELPRHYSLHGRVDPKRFVCMALKCLQIYMPSLKEAIISENWPGWRRSL